VSRHTVRPGTLGLTLNCFSNPKISLVSRGTDAAL
jgi:hypothetical protein